MNEINLKIFTMMVAICLLSLSMLSKVTNATEIEERNQKRNNSDNGIATGILTSIEYELMLQSMRFVEDNRCRRDLNATLNGILKGNQWAVAMYDATVKTAVGIESGIQHQFGHFDECLQQHEATAEGSPVLSQYCLIDVHLDGVNVYDYGKRNKEISNSTIAHWGACLPASCSASDIQIYMQHLLQRQVMVNDEMCQKQTDGVNVTNGMIVYAYIIMFYLFLAIISTAYHMYMIIVAKNDDSMSKIMSQSDNLHIALLSFSFIENTKKLFQASKDHLGLNCINGIKALAMLFILAGHGLSFIYGGPVFNASFMDERVKQPTFAFLSNSLLFVDTFLLLSGFLFCRILLIELERRRGKINVLVLYVARYIRLTPAYMAVIGFYMTWFASIGNGPIWRQRIVREQERCTESWWLNILYINNYFNTNKLCMFQSWYLSVDSQLFFAAPIVIYLLYRTRRHGLRFLIGMVALTALIPFVVTYMRKADPTLLIFSDEMNDLGRNAYYIGLYIKTHMRASAYVMGLLTGYLVHLMQEKGIRFTNSIVRIVWICAIIGGIASMYTVSRFYYGTYTNIESTLYAGFHKLWWNFSIAWLVFATTTGHAPFLQRMLSSRVFAPISRLTYCAYLSNGIVELYHSSSIKVASYTNYINLFNTVFGHILDTFLLAYVLCLLFESPTHALERIIQRKIRRTDRTANSEEQQSESPAPSTSEEQVA